MKGRLVYLSIVLGAQILLSQTPTFNNPIIRGSYPDPSICKVGDDFFLVNSSFEYYPGLPVHKSKDLVNWELIGYGLHRPEQCSSDVNLVDVQSNGGIHAPTIRFHEGLFYIISTNVYYHLDSKTTDFVNFILKAEDPAGPWSNPIVVEGAPGIDPDIFFDSDGRVWYTGTMMPEEPSFPGEGQIWMQELDRETFQLKGQRHMLWRGACGGVWAEGPHIYKYQDHYYLMIAEGGTSFNHAVMIAVSDRITGPYIPNDRNPIFSARHLSYDHWLHSVGHADLIELSDGNWYMVSLGIRGDIDRGSNMGRETNLFPVSWEREPFEWKEQRYLWPVVSAETGGPAQTYPVPFSDVQESGQDVYLEDFSGDELSLEWNFRRVPNLGNFMLDSAKGALRIYGDDALPTERKAISWTGIRQTESDFEFSFSMDIDSKQSNFKAGLGFVQKDDNYLLFNLSKESNRLYLESVLLEKDSEEKLLKKEIIELEDRMWFKIKSLENTYSLSYSLDGEQYSQWDDLPANVLISKGYTGAYLGLFVVGEGKYGDFDNVKYIPYPRN